jgi:hypothetical protein
MHESPRRFSKSLPGGIETEEARAIKIKTEPHWLTVLNRFGSGHQLFVSAL